MTTGEVVVSEELLAIESLAEEELALLAGCEQAARLAAAVSAAVPIKPLRVRLDKNMMKLLPSEMKQKQNQYSLRKMLRRETCTLFR
jgi:hypothetical protein